MFYKKKNDGENDNIWESISDLMTGLMIIFALVAISYLNSWNEHAIQMKKEKFEIAQALREEFTEAERERWGVDIGDDLTIAFTEKSILFALLLAIRKLITYNCLRGGNDGKNSKCIGKG